jgi:hypothetical protein
MNLWTFLKSELVPMCFRRDGDGPEANAFRGKWSEPKQSLGIWRSIKAMRNAAVVSLKISMVSSSSASRTEGMQLDSQVDLRGFWSLSLVL